MRIVKNNFSVPYLNTGRIIRLDPVDIVVRCRGENRFVLHGDIPHKVLDALLLFRILEHGGRQLACFRIAPYVCREAVEGLVVRAFNTPADYDAECPVHKHVPAVFIVGENILALIQESPVVQLYVRPFRRGNIPENASGALPGLFRFCRVFFSFVRGFRISRFRFGIRLSRFFFLRLFLPGVIPAVRFLRFFFGVV